MLSFLLLDILLAFALDLILGDPYWLPHPVRFIGWLVKNMEKLLRSIPVKLSPDNVRKKAKLEITAGVFLAVFTTGVTFLTVFLILKAAYLVSPVFFHVINIYFIYSSLATRCLSFEVKKVYLALKKGDIEKGRNQLAFLVGRQTENLDEKEIIRGAMETTAENTVDGILSPLMYVFIGTFFGIGAPLVYAFKAISTLDSMVGYMNEKYVYFGRASAKTDDAANYIPSRLSGLIIPLAAFFCGKSFYGSFRIMLRDRRNHKSPNCAYPEAAVAGALGVKIGGTNTYFGKAVEKPAIGDAVKELDVEDIRETIRIMYVAAFLFILVEAFISVFIFLLR